MRKTLAACLAILPITAAQLPEIRLLNLAPSPYTNRHDSFRAGCGLLLSLRRLIQEHKLALRATFRDAVPALDHPEEAKALVHCAQVLVIGASTWAQGPATYPRRFFELVDAEDIADVSATAYATAGGQHTGGEEVIASTLRTLMGMGAQVFSLGQKYVVFQTGERFEPREGDFTMLDCWFMDQFARNIAVVALAGNDPGKAGKLEKQLDFTPVYWKNFPKNEAAIAPRYRDLRDQLNQAADPASAAAHKLQALVE